MILARESFSFKISRGLSVSWTFSKPREIAKVIAFNFFLALLPFVFDVGQQ